VFHTCPVAGGASRLSAESLTALRESLRRAGLTILDTGAIETRLETLRSLYEPIVNALAEYFEFTLPLFQSDKPPVDNWQTSPWMSRAPRLDSLSGTYSESGPSHEDRH
jgi:hypothetical protein